MATAPTIDLADRPPAAAPARVDVAVLSIGGASLRTATAVARGLGVPVEAAVQAIYRAPARLVQGVAEPLAARLCATLAEAGLEVAVVAPDAALPAVPLLDVAAHLADPLAAPAAAEALHRFTGMGADAALAMLLAPPGVVLGGVSAATVAALTAALPAGVELVTSDPRTARFQLLLDDAPDIVARGVRAELSARGIAPLGTTGIVAADLDHATAQAIWQRFSRTGALRLVNQDFTRFAIVIDPIGAFTSAQAELLEAEAGIPAAALAAIAAQPQVELHDGLTFAEATARLARYAEAGLAVRAELTSFRRHRLEIVAAPDRAGLAALLVAHGLLPAGGGVPRLPFVTPEALPEPRARLARALLEAAGAEVYLA